MKAATTLVAGLAPASILAQPQSNFAQDCAALADKLTSIENSTIAATTFVSAGTNLTFPGVAAACDRPSQVVTTDICRAQLNITTSDTSGFVMEAWLPTNWTGRFLSTGNGGLGGCIQYEDLDYTTSLGFAAVGTNNGHNGMSGESFLNNPGVVEDFVYRAQHLGVVTGKMITNTFYSTPHGKSYYLGCSTGGRQGMKEVQDFPDDFDGVVAGAPAINFNNLNTWSLHFLPVTGSNTSDTFVSEELWDVVHQDILNQCDALDGQEDGILEEPGQCQYQADGLLCGDAGNNDTAACLTAKQVNTVNTIFSAMLAPDGRELYPRMNPGSEATGAFDSSYNGQPSDKGDWMKDVVFSDPNFNLSAFTPDLWTKSDELNPFDAATWNGDISPFQQRGGKLLHYHGTMDQIISSDISPQYYELVSETMAMEPAQLDDFYRFFRVSGMAHCRGGPGAHYIGNQDRNLASLDPDENVLMAMVRWVEEGVAPDTITGTAFVDDEPSGEVAFKRRHCRYPTRNQYQSGDPNSPDSWACIS